MPVCAITGSAGLELQQMASAADLCSGVVLLQVADVPPNPLYMDMATGSLMAGAVGTVWLAAWAWKAIYRALDSDTKD